MANTPLTIAAFSGLILFAMVCYIAGFRAGERRAERRENHAHASAELAAYFDEPRRLLTHDTIEIPLPPITQVMRRVT